LDDLKDTDMLSMRLLDCFKAWDSSSASQRHGAVDAAISFFKSCHLLCDIPDKPGKLLVSARLASRHVSPSAIRRMHLDACFNVFYLVPLNHVGFMAQFMSALTSRQPRQLAISIEGGSDAVCMRGDDRSCCISVADVPDSIEIVCVMSSFFHSSSAHGIVDGQRILFVGNDIPHEIDRTSSYIAVVATEACSSFQVRPEDSNSVVKVLDVEQCTFCVVCLQQEQNHADPALQLPACQRNLAVSQRLGVALRISANDTGFFAFAVECADSLMSSGAFSMRHQCWVPCRDGSDVVWNSFHDNKFPMKIPPQFQQSELPDWLLTVLRDYQKHMPLHKALKKRDTDVVVNNPRQVQKRHLFSRTPGTAVSVHNCNRVFFSCSYEDDGTLEFSRHFKNRLEDRALLSCSYQHDGSDEQIADAMRQASAIFIFLSPQYLTQARCLQQLALALKLCRPSSSKTLHIICTHPAVSHRSRVNMLKCVSEQQRCFIFVKEGSPNASSSESPVFGAYEISNTFATLMQQLNGIESHDKTDDWMRFRCWQSYDKQWRESNLSCESCELFAQIDAFVKQEACSYVLAQDRSSFVDLAADGSCAPSKISCFDQTSLTSIAQELYPQSMAIFGPQNMASVLQLASFGLSDDDIVQRVSRHSAAAESSRASAIDVAVAASGVDFTEARRQLLKIRANYQGTGDSKDFDEWIKSALPRNKLVCRVEGTDDVMLFHTLLSKREFTRKEPKDCAWSDFTYAYGGNQDNELRMCPEKLNLDRDPEDGRQGVLEKPVPFDVKEMHVLTRFYASKAVVSWFAISDNDLKASSIETQGTLRSKDRKV